MTINVNVKGQTMRLECAPEVVSGTQDFVKLRFNLSEDWAGLNVFAQFVQGNSSYNVYLDLANSVFLPAEIKDGICYVSLCGTKDDVVATSNALRLRIIKHCIVQNGSSTEISHSLYQQLADKVNALLNGETPKPLGGGTQTGCSCCGMRNIATDEEVSEMLDEFFDEED